MITRPVRLCLLAVALVAATACTNDDAPTPSPTPTNNSTGPDTTSPPPTTLTQSDTTLTRQRAKPTKRNAKPPDTDAKLHVSIEQLGGGIDRARRPALERAIARPIARWIEGAYADTSPRTSYGQAFTGWTGEARRLAKRDRETTTNAAVRASPVGLVVDRRVVGLYVFASKGRTGGATATVDVRLTTEPRGGSVHSYAVTGRLYLVRDRGRWRIFGYDLSRREVPS